MSGTALSILIEAVRAVSRSLRGLADSLDFAAAPGTSSEVRARAVRAWEAGPWAKATLEHRVAKPRPTPKLALQATCCIILRGPGIDRPVRVSSSAEYFKLPPSFENSVSHSFPSLAEGHTYCLGAGPVEMAAEVKYLDQGVFLVHVLSLDFALFDLEGQGASPFY